MAELPIQIAHASLPEAGAFGAGIGRLCVDVPGLFFVDPVVQDDSAVFIPRSRKGGFDLATRMSIERVEIVLESTPIDAIGGAFPTLESRSEGRAFADVLMGGVVDLPVGLDPIADGDRSHFGDTSNPDIQPQNTVAFFPKVALFHQSDVFGVGSHIDPEQPPLVKSSQQRARDGAQSAGVEESKILRAPNGDGGRGLGVLGGHIAGGG